MNPSVNNDELIRALFEPARYPHPVRRVRVEETHISWVLLTGEYAYKIKKPVNFGFLDYSTLARRLICCQEELRLNRRFAPDLYLDVVAIGGSAADPELPATGAPIEYAVRMREFPADARLDLRLKAGLLHPADIDQLAGVVARVHAEAPRSSPADHYGEPARCYAPIRDNFDALRTRLDSESAQAQLATIATWSEQAYATLREVMAARKLDGWVRECHGDLHLGNIAWVDGVPTLFDGIEFNADLRWIDVMSEAAFLCMDLMDRGRADLAWRWLNAYLSHTGDYAGVTLLRFYQCYRAMVRAKVAMLRLDQEAHATHAAQTRQEAQTYLDLAARFTTPPPACLIVMHGLSGSGKTYISQQLLEQLGAIRLRSDVERKRLAGLVADADSNSGIGTGLYSAQHNTDTYRHLAALASALLTAGQRVIVDAACLYRAPRDQWRALARQQGVQHLFVSCQAETGLLRERITHRAACGQDASEAGLDVLDAQLRGQEPLADDEQRDCAVIDSRDAGYLERIRARLSDS